MIDTDEVKQVEIRCAHIPYDPLRACLLGRFGLKAAGSLCFFVGTVDADGCWACLWDGFSYEAAIIEAEAMADDWAVPVIDQITSEEFGAGPSRHAITRG